jgi:hypothetical protein
MIEGLQAVYARTTRITPAPAATTAIHQAVSIH